MNIVAIFDQSVQDMLLEVKNGDGCGDSVLDNDFSVINVNPWKIPYKFFLRKQDMTWVAKRVELIYCS